MNYEDINIDEATIVDVREPFECETGMVEGSINIPLGEVPNKVEEFKTMKKPLVLCCKSGNRSGQAVQFLKSHGIEAIYNGGSWREVNDKL